LDENNDQTRNNGCEMVQKFGLGLVWLGLNRKSKVNVGLVLVKIYENTCHGMGTTDQSSAS